MCWALQIQLSDLKTPVRRVGAAPPRYGVPVQGDFIRRPGSVPRKRPPEYVGLHGAADINARLLYEIELIKSLEEHYGEGFSDIAPEGSDLHDDDAALSPLWLSSYAAHTLAVAIDSLRAGRLIIEDPEEPRRARLTVMGHYPPLRAALEGASTALWLLAPADPRVRQLRTLRAYFRDLQEDSAFLAEAQKPRLGDSVEATMLKQRMLDGNAFSGRRVAIEQVAARRGYEKSAWKGEKLGVSIVLSEIDPAINAPLLSVMGVWRFLSGLSHPSLTRSLMGSEIEHQPGGDNWYHIRHTADGGMTIMAFDLAMLVTDKALNALARRSGIDELRWTRPKLVPPGWRL